MSLPSLAPLLKNPAALSILVHNPKICARTVARPEEMSPVIRALAEKYSGPEHQGGALDDLFPVLHLKGVEVMDVTSVATPEAAVVRRHHQDAMDAFEAPSEKLQATQQQVSKPPHAATLRLAQKQGSPQYLAPPSQQQASQSPQQQFLTPQRSHQHLAPQFPPEQYPTSQFSPLQVIPDPEAAWVYGSLTQHLSQYPDANETIGPIKSTVDRRPATNPSPQPDARTQTAGSKIREILAEMLVERGTTMRPRWGGRLLEVLANPRGPFGISSISDALAPAVEDMKKEHPRLVASLINNGGYCTLKKSNTCFRTHGYQ